MVSEMKDVGIPEAKLPLPRPPPYSIAAAYINTRITGETFPVIDVASKPAPPAVDVALSNEVVAAPGKIMITLDEFPTLHFEILDARRNSRLLDGGATEFLWYAKYRYSAPPPTAGSSAKRNIEWIDFIVSGSEEMSKSYDRESHNMKAVLSTGEKLTLYNDVYDESGIQDGPSHIKDASDANRKKLAAYLSSLHSMTTTPVDLSCVCVSGPDAAFSFSSTSILNLAKALEARVM